MNRQNRLLTRGIIVSADAEIKAKAGYSPVIDWGYYDEDPSKNAGKVNILATRTPKNATGKSLIFNGHVDVVPTGPHHLWTNPPFSPYVKEGRLYGRGAGDMKAGIVAYYQAYSTFDSFDPYSFTFWASVPYFG